MWRECISLDCLARVSLTEPFKREVLKIISPVAQRKYVAIVIRHSTDYQTDYKKVLSHISSKISGKTVLLCSDSRIVIDYAKEHLKSCALVSLNNEVENGDQSLFDYVQNAPTEQKYKVFVKSISDLLALSLSQELYVPKLQSGGIRGGYSGFTLLAALLQKNRQIQRQLLGIL